MPWSSSRPNGDKTAEKYRSKKHRDTRATMKAQLERDGSAQCAQPVCVMPSRLILIGMRWCAGHDVTGTYYIGPVHEVCNRKDAAVQARAKQGPKRPPQYWSRRWC